MGEYTIKLLKQPQKYLDKLSDKDAESIRNGLNKLQDFDGDVKAMNGMPGYYRLRVRDWRIIFEVADNSIIVHAIGPRGDVYK